jgi:hypothetical protein
MAWKSQPAVLQHALCVFRRIVTADFGIVTGLSGRS